MVWHLRYRQNKYGAKSSNYNGILYHSKMEAQHAADLDMLVKAGQIKSWERQVPIQLNGEKGSPIAKYYVDFVIHHNNGTTEYVECKGFETEIFRLKWKMFEDKMKDVPDVKITMVK